MFFIEDDLRSLVKDSLSKNLYQNAEIFAEMLVSSSNSTLADVILYAKCHLGNGQPRRCLSVLERKGLLSNTTIKSIQLVVNPCPVKMLNNRVVPSSEELASVADSLNGVYIGAQCLFLIGQYEDCLSLVDSLVIIDENESHGDLTLVRNKVTSTVININQLSALYCLVGKCYFAMDNRPKALTAMLTSLKMDLACLESLDFISEHCLLSQKGLIDLYQRLVVKTQSERNWLTLYYQKMFILHSNNVDHQSVEVKSGDVGNTNLVQQTECNFRLRHMKSTHHCAKYSYSLDPYDMRKLTVYVASLVHLNQLTELFYLGHELVHSFPKNSLSWYTVGCFYWCCNKMDVAQSFLNKAVQIDKRNAKCWIMLGHVFSAQEENEQSIASYRTAIRLLPGDYAPMLFMAKELLRTNHYFLALQILLVSLKYSSNDPLLLNEIGVAYFKLNNYNDSIIKFFNAINMLVNVEGIRNGIINYSLTFNQVYYCEVEIMCNYASSLRKCHEYSDALAWFEKCLALSPLDANCHIEIGFTLHLMRRFKDAITVYHRALALQPNNYICLELLVLVVEDNFIYSHQKYL